MIEWKEREHEMDDIAALRSPRTRAALRACGLLKFFKLQKMKSEVLLLEHIIGLWDTNEQGFRIGAQLLTIELEDVYFLTGLSKRGVPIAFTGQRTLPEQVDVYLARHCVPGARLVGGRIPIKDIRDLALRSILFAITSATGSTSAHLASRSQVAYGVQCLEPTLFNWSAAFLRNVKEQITRCRNGQKQFGYGSFLVSFFMERIPQMQPQIALAVRPVDEPRMERWTSLSPRLVSESEFRFTGDFFAWLRRQFLWIEDFPYADVDFRRSMDLILPEGEDWDESGKRLSRILSPVSFYVFWCIIFFLVCKRAFNRCFVFNVQTREQCVRWTYRCQDVVAAPQLWQNQSLQTQQHQWWAFGRLRGTSRALRWVSLLCGEGTCLCICSDTL
jgi:hypothetical protein